MQQAIKDAQWVLDKHHRGKGAASAQELTEALRALLEAAQEAMDGAEVFASNYRQLWQELKPFGDAIRAYQDASDALAHEEKYRPEKAAEAKKARTMAAQKLTKVVLAHEFPERDDSLTAENILEAYI